MSGPTVERIEAALERLEERRRTGDRRIAMPPRRRAPIVIDGATFTACRLCAEPIVRPDGRPDRRKLWHPECVAAYRAATSSERTREEVFRRDHGVCAVCGRACAKRTDPAMWTNGRYRDAEGRWWHVIHEWAADHIVPIVDGGALRLSNLQTLCGPCHAAKTAREATERAGRRRAAARRQAIAEGRLVEQIELFDLEGAYFTA